MAKKVGISSVGLGKGALNIGIKRPGIEGTLSIGNVNRYFKANALRWGDTDLSRFKEPMWGIGGKFRF